MPKSRWISCQLKTTNAIGNRRAGSPSRCKSGSARASTPLSPAPAPGAARGDSGNGARSPTGRPAPRPHLAVKPPPEKCKACHGRDTSAQVVVRTDLPASSSPSEAALRALARGVTPGRRAARRSPGRWTSWQRRRGSCQRPTSRSSACRSGEELETVAVSGPAALAAELDGTHLVRAICRSRPSPSLRLPRRASGARQRAPAQSRCSCSRPHRPSAGTLELYRAGAAFTATERFAAELAAGQAALVLRVFGGGARPADARSPSHARARRRSARRRARRRRLRLGDRAGRRERRRRAGRR